VEDRRRLLFVGSDVCVTAVAGLADGEPETFPGSLTFVTARQD
jgi:hypothetical protein